MVNILESVGSKTIKIVSSIYEFFTFSSLCIAHIFTPKSYNPAMRMVLVKQIYLTSIRILPLFVVMAFLFGSTVIGVLISIAAEYSLQDNIGSIIISFAVDEFAPFFTALFISFHLAAAVNTEISLMQVNKELNTLQEYKIDLIDYLFLPRIISGMISATSLSILFTIIMLSSGYIFAFLYMNMELHTYKHFLIDALEIKDIVILFFKSMAFGFVIMLIPIYSAFNIQNSYTAITTSILTGMVRLFIAIFSIEVVSLIIHFL